MEAAAMWTMVGTMAVYKGCDENFPSMMWKRRFERDGEEKKIKDKKKGEW